MASIEQFFDDDSVVIVESPEVELTQIKIKSELQHQDYDHWSGSVITNIAVGSSSSMLPTSSTRTTYFEKRINPNSEGEQPRQSAPEATATTQAQAHFMAPGLHNEEADKDEESGKNGLDSNRVELFLPIAECTRVKVARAQKEDITTIRKTMHTDRVVSFHVKEMKQQLDAAMRYASDGDTFLMEHTINKAVDHALECMSCNDSFMLQVATIRQTINEDRKISFHFEEMRSQLKAAMKYASKGDKSLMEHCINKAETDALECGSYNDAFLEHVAKIQQTTSPNIERSFHFEEMRSHLKAAMKYASKGDKSLMEHCINKAETNALDCGFYNDAFLEQVAKIQQAISTNIERSFHFEEM